ncbi:MAG TPA: YigZ family protein [Planctomycetes bacterium]|nr:YigZ family protein [Planctomycetota bacterium]
MSSFLGIDAPCAHEIEKIKGSRFLGFAFPVRDEEEALALVAEKRKQFHDARHWCWAYRLGIQGDRFRYQDDGEPSGTAGLPILKEIDARGLTDVLVLVVRYFGGTKLGTGGLARAYAQAAREVLERAALVEVRIDRPVRVSFSYEDTSAVQSVLHRFQQQAIEATYGERTELLFSVPSAQAESFAQALRDATSNRAQIQIGPEAPGQRTPR